MSEIDIFNNEFIITKIGFKYVEGFNNDILLNH